MYPGGRTADTMERGLGIAWNCSRNFLEPLPGNKERRARANCWNCQLSWL